MNHHPFHAFTMRDGTVACSQCNAPLSDPVHLPELPGYVAEMVAEITRLRDEVDRVKTREMIFLRSNGELTKEVLDLRSERDRAWGLNNSLVTQVAMISGANEQLRAAREEAERDATFQYKDKLGERAMRMVQEKCVEHLKEQLAAKDARIAELERLAEYEADLVKLNTVEGATGAKA